MEEDDYLYDLNFDEKPAASGVDFDRNFLAETGIQFDLLDPSISVDLSTLLSLGGFGDISDTDELVEPGKIFGDLPSTDYTQEEISLVDQTSLLTGDGIPLSSPASTDAGTFSFAGPDSTSASVKPKRGGRRRQVSKDSDEYRVRRDRNNVAVRKSRDKAKLKQQETEGLVTQLREENAKLRKHLDGVLHQHRFLRSLLTQAQIKISPEAEKELHRLTNGPL